MAVATLGAWIINELNSLLTQQKLNLEESRLLDCNILETSEGLAAIAAHTCFLTSIALCASESFKLQGEGSVSASPNDNATAQGLASISISSLFVQHHLEWKSSDNSMDPGGTSG